MVQKYDREERGVGHDDTLDTDDTFPSSDSESELNDSDSANVSKSAAQDLQELLDREEEESTISRSRQVDEKCMRLTSAALALAAEEATRM